MLLLAFSPLFFYAGSPLSMGRALRVPYSAWATIRKYHRLSDFKQHNLFSHSSEVPDQSLVGSVPGVSSLPG